MLDLSGNTAMYIMIAINNKINILISTRAFSILNKVKYIANDYRTKHWKTIKNIKIAIIII